MAFNPTAKLRLVPLLALVGLVLAFLTAAGAPLAAGSEPGAGELRARYEALRGALAQSPFGKPVYLQSSEGARTLKGEVYAVVDYPFATVDEGLRDAANWCHVLILPFNTKHCRAADGGEATRLSVRVGRKSDQPAEDAYLIDFKYRVAMRTADYLRIVLRADEGPLGTRDYQILLEATPLENGRTFIHLSYSYGFGTMSRLMMQTYLGTVARSKVGFTVVGKDSGGGPVYVGGMLGATERNTMRYFLAIDAYLASLSAPAEARVEKRLAYWFAATERHSRQLHEMDEREYLAMKKRETQRIGKPLSLTLAR
jgi:hypothetical protein